MTGAGGAGGGGGGGGGTVIVLHFMVKIHSFVGRQMSKTVMPCAFLMRNDFQKKNSQ